MWWYKDGIIDMKVLLTYSSGFGTTKEVSEKIAEVLVDGGIDVTIQSIDDVPNINEYDAVIVGSSVRADKPLANVRDFFARYNAELTKKHVAIFAVCLAANCQKGREKVKSEYISQITQRYPELNPISTEAFGGKIDFDHLNPVMQQLMKRVLVKTGIETEGSVDTRDWDFIESWAIELRGQLDKAA